MTDLSLRSSFSSPLAALAVDTFARRNQEHTEMSKKKRKITNNEEDNELIPEDDNRGSNVSRSSVTRFCLAEGLAATIS